MRLHLPVALPLVPGDRYVLREAGRGETVGGGEVLDVDPVLPAARARPDRRVERVVAERGWVAADELARLTGAAPTPTVGRWVVDPAVLAEAEAGLRAAVDAAGALGLEVATLDERQRAVVTGIEGVVVVGGRARWATAPDAVGAHPVLAALAAEPLAPPDPATLDRDALQELVRRGLVVRRSGICFTRAAVDEATHRLADLLAARPEGVTVAEARDLWGTTRRYALALFAELDATGVTRRRGDVRVAGPRLPAIEPPGSDDGGGRPR